EIKDVNSKIVASIENHAQNNIELTLDGVFDFMNKRKDFHPNYKVFKEYFVVCWAGKIKKIKNDTYYSRLDIELINEQVKLFYSELDEVSISITDDYFKIVEYVHLGLENKFQYYPLEEVSIKFRDNASYEMESKLLFEPPQFDKKILYHIYNANNALLSKLKNGSALNKQEERDLVNLPATYLICYFNQFEDAIEKLERAKEVLRLHSKKAYREYKESLRILRKVKYS
ncbi:MAG TPA: DUF5929 domain-containing protein, partial [Gillisia sp.]|nr:DUF5929 domain-containing protein [Gillisia sp.]